MKSKRLFGKVALIVFALMIVSLSAISLMACNDTKAYSNEIFIEDFSETYTISVKAKVRNHSILPEGSRTFEYSKGFDKLYEAINNAPQNGSALKYGDIIFIDQHFNGRTYSCIIYPTGEKNKYVVHSMTYKLGEWANRMKIFFPAYLLDKEISYYDSESTTYQCEYNIQALRGYYIQRGYYATINDNILHVICLLRYPSTFEVEKAISWSIVYENENTIRFADISNEYK